MPVYNKLVRDKILDIIRASGKQPRSRILSEQEFRDELIKKLGEEYQEFLEDPSAEELADIKEVVAALEKVISTPEEVERVRTQKAAERGVFEDKIFLIEVTDE
jgi:predicted house-cleaning noncanonical NTP pyrophosphatase (MazG superfamily)